VAAEDDAVLLAGLFALHPEPGRTTLPGALREIARSSDSVEQRFRALLGAARPDLPVHLRHAVGLVGSHHIALDWRELHRAIRFWDHPSGRTKRAWARQFWAAGDPAAEHAEHTTA
jgi:CRISPR type I-E-associated protein CasB/Cse2